MIIEITETELEIIQYLLRKELKGNQAIPYERHLLRRFLQEMYAEEINQKRR